MKLADNQLKHPNEPNEQGEPPKEGTVLDVKSSLVDTGVGVLSKRDQGRVIAGPPPSSACQNTQKLAPSPNDSS